MSFLPYRLIACYLFELMAKGTIKKIVEDKGFGFISKEDGDLFFHRSAVEGCRFEDLHEGQKVKYTEGTGQKGPCATTVEIDS